LYNSFRIGYKYLGYLLSARSGKGHGIHSPFVYQFIQQVLNDRKRYPELEQAERYRRSLLNNHEKITVLDLGAGSVKGNAANRRIADIARRSAKSYKYSSLLFRMVRMYQSNRILELGTSLGISTACLSLANPRAKVVTIEGAPAVAAVAGQGFLQMGLDRIQVLTGDFDDRLPAALHSCGSPDLVFFDGNHQKVPTLRYFQACLEKASPDSIFIFDDIHWSKGMEEAWQDIQSHPAVTCTIDLFFIGIVFFRKEFKERRHFVIRY
jgi:predicted O-methyltransferase YrrM